MEWEGGDGVEEVEGGDGEREGEGGGEVKGE